jgi:hypothetical protein
VSAWCGLQVRKSVRNRINGPKNWLLSPLTISTLNRWPMLAFDTWTLGVIGLIGVLMLVTY